MSCLTGESLELERSPYRREFAGVANRWNFAGPWPGIKMRAVQYKGATENDVSPSIESPSSRMKLNVVTP